MKSPDKSLKNLVVWLNRSLICNYYQQVITFTENTVL
jgi:hypothetical protein